MFSSKQTKDIGDMVCNQAAPVSGKPRRKADMTDEEKSRLMLLRDVFHESMKDQNLCVVLPDGKSEQEVFGDHLPALRSRLRRRNVTVVWYKDLTVEHIDGNNCVVDLSGIRITL